MSSIPYVSQFTYVEDKKNITKTTSVCLRDVRKESPYFLSINELNFSLFSAQGTIEFVLLSNTNTKQIVTRGAHRNGYLFCWRNKTHLTKAVKVSKGIIGKENVLLSLPAPLPLSEDSTPPLLVSGRFTPEQWLGPLFSFLSRAALRCVFRQRLSGQFCTCFTMPVIKCLHVHCRLNG